MCVCVCVCDTSDACPATMTEIESSDASVGGAKSSSSVRRRRCTLVKTSVSSTAVGNRPPGRIKRGTYCTRSATRGLGVRFGAAPCRSPPSATIASPARAKTRRLPERTLSVKKAPLVDVKSSKHQITCTESLLGGGVRWWSKYEVEYGQWSWRPTPSPPLSPSSWPLPLPMSVEAKGA